MLLSLNSFKEANFKRNYALVIVTLISLVTPEESICYSKVEMFFFSGGELPFSDSVQGARTFLCVV